IMVGYRPGSPAGDFGDQQGCPFERGNNLVCKYALFKMHCRFSSQAVSERCFSYYSRVEIRTFQEHIAGGFRNTRIQPAENTGDTHGPLRMVDHQISFIQFAFGFVQGSESLAGSGTLNDQPGSGDGPVVKCMQGLPEFVQHKIGNIYYIVQGADTDGFQATLQPFRGGAYLHTGDCQ